MNKEKIQLNKLKEDEYRKLEKYVLKINGVKTYKINKISRESIVIYDDKKVNIDSIFSEIEDFNEHALKSKESKDGNDKGDILLGAFVGVIVAVVVLFVLYQLIN